MPNDLSELPEEAIVKIESKLFKSYAQMAAIVDSSEDAIVGMALNNLVSSWNKAARNIYGYEPKEIIGKNINILWPVENSDEITELTRRVLASEPIRNHETVHSKKDGTQFLASMTLSPVKDDQDAIFGLSMISRNITEEKNAAEKLNKFEEVDRLNRLMIDREIKMVELKDRIKVLEDKLKVQS